MLRNILITLLLASPLVAQVTGTVRFDGEPPPRQEIDAGGVPECHALHVDPILDDQLIIAESGAVANVVVTITLPDGKSIKPATPATRPAVLDQIGCVYTPHVLVAKVGQKLVIRNSDGFAHIVNGITDKNQGFNFTQDGNSEGDDVGTFISPEFFRVKCAVHPWMLGWVVVVDHPYSDLTGEAGTYNISGLPDGQYVLHAWHEKLGELEQPIEMRDGKAEADLTYRAE